MKKKYITILALAMVFALSGCCLSHEWEAATCELPETCVKCGKTQGDALGHTWVDADCVTPKNCSVCGKTEGNALGHNLTEADCVTPPTCSVCGAVEDEALGHTWADADCVTPKTCSVCSETEGEALGHSANAVSCTEDSVCAVCGVILEAAPGHDAVPATQTEDSVCARCGELLERATGVWEKIHFLDQFGDQTDEWYLHSQVDGIYTGNIAGEETLKVDAVIYEDSVQFHFVEVLTSSQKQAEDCIISTKDSDGAVTQYSSHANAQADWICIEGSDALAFMRQIHQNAVLKIAVTGSSERYTFSLNGKDDAAGVEEFLSRVYSMAEAALADLDFERAEKLFFDLGTFRDAPQRAEEVKNARSTFLQNKYEEAEAMLQAGDYAGAQAGFEALGDYADSAQRVDDVKAACSADKHVVSTATIGATGDFLMHMPIINSALQADGSYNFDDIFQYLNSYSLSVDYAIASLETTLCGADNGYRYFGSPVFNCPDEIVDSLYKAGFDMLLTANNHCYDTGEVGFYRTIETIRSYGLDNLGTMLSGDEPKYKIVDINGIKVGMLCYTYSDSVTNPLPGRIYLNYSMMHENAKEEINAFDPGNLAPFYEEVASYLNQMRADGAEAIIIFMHWGQEYRLTPGNIETAMAQRLCDLGVDVIIGGHPHVVQPIEILNSTTVPGHRTVCLYSMGNALSNQRLGNLSSITTAHTEDGVWFTVKFDKYSDGTVRLDSIDLIPCWVDLRTGKEQQYCILPLDPATMDFWETNLDLSGSSIAAAQNSYERTMDTVSPGLAAAAAAFDSPLKLSKTDITIGKRGVFFPLTLDGDIDPENVTWTTSDSAVATVYNGNVTAISRGVCIITAEYNGQQAQCVVRCKW